MFLAFVVLTVIVESRDLVNLFGDGDSCDAPEADVTPPSYARLYHWFLRTLSNSSATQVALIAIPADLHDVQENLCHGRAYLARLVTTVAAQHPLIIVIDKFFSPGSCQSNPEEKKDTDALLSAVQNAGVPVIVGKSTDLVIHSDLRKKNDAACLVDKDQLNFKASNLAAGLLRLNVNKEQIPLRWPVFPRQPSGGEPNLASAPEDSLALRTLEVLDPKLVAKRHFQSLLHSARQPYAKIGATPPAYIASTNLKENLASIAGKVVVIGAINDVDRWIVLGKPWWGFQLQGLYIQALLSGHYLRAPPGYLPIALFAIFIAALEGVPVFGARLHRHRNPKRKWRVPKLFRKHLPWICIFWPISVAAILIGFRLSGYLPPLFMVFAVLFAGITRLIIAGTELGQDLFAPEEKR